MNRLPLLILCIVVFPVLYVGCGPMDPLMHWELYKPSQPSESFQVAVLTSSYEAWGKTNYGNLPRVRIMGKNGQVWEFLLPDRDPKTWELWTVAPGGERKRVPFVLSSKISRWGHPKSPWEMPQGVSGQAMPPKEQK